MKDFIPKNTGNVIKKQKQEKKTLWQIIKPMTGKERAEYIWEYYNWTLWIVLIVGIVLSVVITSYVNKTTKVVISGTLVNLDVSTDGYKYLVDDYNALHKLGGRQRVDFGMTNFKNFKTASDIESNYNASISVVASAAAKTLDYCILDQTGMEYYLGHEIFMDLRDILTPEEIEKWKDSRLVYAREEDSDEPIPVALKITDEKFVKDNLVSFDDVYIAFIVSTPKKEMCRDFFDYLMAYK